MTGALSGRSARRAVVLVLGLLLWSRVTIAAEQVQLILHMLDYMAVDYPEFVQDGVVLDTAEYAEQLEFAQQVSSLLAQLPAQQESSTLLSQASRLLALVQNKAPGDEVSTLASQLRGELIQGYDIVIAPRHPPDLILGATLYQTHCSGCHGVEGQGDGPAGKHLDPSPSNFHNQERMEQRSLYSLYSTITLGVEGTGMASFQHLSDAERWSLALYVGNFPSTPESLATGEALWQSGVGRTWFATLSQMTALTAREVRARHGNEGEYVLAYLRHHPDIFTDTAESPLARSRRLLHESLGAYRQGQSQAAQELAVSAYLDGFELVEASLDTLDRPLRTTIETGMLEYRQLLRSGAPLARVEARESALQALFVQTEALLTRTRMAPLAAFLSSFLILLREGLEALLVVIAIMAFLTKAQRRDALLYVHAGWVLALGCGVLTWFVASYLMTISGATREITEGMTSLIAAAVLLYVGFWMHSRAYTGRWNTFLSKQLHGTLRASTLGALTLVAFLAVYREAFEVVLFYQALWLQAAPAYSAVLGGLLSAVVALLGLGWLLRQGSIRLPLSQFFGCTAILLALMAVIFAGQGIAALQEAGTLPASMAPLPRFPALGLYPTWQGLLLQLLLLAVIASGFSYTYYSARGTRTQEPT